MELRQLRSFVAVAEELSFRRAAERLHVSQPPLSRQIKALEEELGTRLLRRNRASRVSLTAEGHAFLVDARKTLSSADAALKNLKEVIAGTQGILYIGNIAHLSARVLPAILQTFHRKFPRVEISLHEMPRAKQLAALREERIHVCLFPDLGVPLEPCFESQPLFSCPMVAVLPSSHHLAKRAGRSMNIRALATETLVTPSPQDAPGYFERMNQLYARANFAPTACHSVEGNQNVLGMVAAGYGVSILPEVVVDSHAGNYQIRPLLPPVPPFLLKLIWLRGRSSRVLKNFLAVAKSEATNGLKS